MDEAVSPVGRVLLSRQDSLRHLPSSDERHWLPRHKAAVVAAVRCGALTLEEVSKRYMLTKEEFDSWKEAIDRNGITGLRAGPRERRRTPRKSVSEPAAVKLHAETQASCVITNISDVGARLRFRKTIAVPDQFELHCTRSGRSWWVNLVWQSDRSAGVRFRNPLPPPWTVKSGLGEWLLGKRRTVTIDRIDKV